uniref:Uncharacterized protein n=1 Tax=Rhizophora mucronata TaxID=61149 RepID=A0A2P2JBV7_RHIMU
MVIKKTENKMQESSIQTIIPWFGPYSLIRTWLMSEGNNPDSSYTLCVIFVNQGGTVIDIVRQIPNLLR